MCHLHPDTFPAPEDIDTPRRRRLALSESPAHCFCFNRTRRATPSQSVFCSERISNVFPHLCVTCRGVRLDRFVPLQQLRFTVEDAAGLLRVVPDFSVSLDSFLNDVLASQVLFGRGERTLRRSSY